ncbi:MAG: radical SAM protein, partial [Candidatus Margulisiibacteriota bacterium]
IRSGNQKQVFGKLSNSLSAIEPPLWSALFAAFLRDKGHSVKIIDAEAENMTPDEVAEKVLSLKPKLAAFIVTGNNLSASIWNMTATSEYIKSLNIKTEGSIKTLLWSIIPSALPERTLREEDVDYVCVGEGFYLLDELVSALKAEKDPKEMSIQGLWFIKDGKIIDGGRSQIVKDLDDLPTPAWDLLPMDKYRAHNWHCYKDIENRQPYGILYTSMGCPFNCSFCTIKTLFEGKPGIRYRSPKKVLEDLDVLVNKYHVKNIKLFDECFVLNMKHVNEICDMIIERGYDLNIWAYSRVDTVNEAILKKMRKAGFTWLAYGIESGTKKALPGVSKGRYGYDDIVKVVKMTKDAGIYMVANFMFGLPDDDLQSMQDTLEMAKELNCEFTSFYVTVAYPGSKLYEEALQQNIKLPDRWVGYAQFSEECLPLPTKHLSAEEVLRFRDKAFTEIFESKEYQDLIKEKFGQPAVDHINEMLKVKIKRKILERQ